MKWILITMQAFVMMFCLVYETSARAEGPVPEVTEKTLKLQFYWAYVC